MLKPKHSGFYATTLELLLRYLKADQVIITGIAGDNCVLFTAADAYMREFNVAVPADCVVSLDEDSNQSALEHMRHPSRQTPGLRERCVFVVRRRCREQ